jgi:integrase/DNA-directed RNA polymerase subunit RPC12/RpoP
MICSKCSKSFQDDAVFCPYCGKKQVKLPQKHRVKSRGNGTGTAFKRGSTWTAQVVYDRVVVADDKPLKKLTRSKGGFKTRDEALRYCPILKNGPEKPVLAPTLTSYWEAYKKGPYEALSASKQQAYRTAWKKLSDIAGTRVDQLTVSDLQDLVAKQCNSYYTARDVRTLLINLFRIASAEGYVRQELPTFIQLPSLEEKERTPFSETEQRALWKLYEDKHDLRAAIPLLMIYTGMMPGEAMALKVEHIDLDKQQITGVGMKTKVRKQAPIVLMKALLPLVQDLIDNAQPSGYIWKRVEKEWYDAYYGALEAAGCRRLTPYSCRHTTASALAITKNVAPQTVTKIMRWSSSKMLDRYAHPDQKDAQRAVNRLKKPV